MRSRAALVSAAGLASVFTAAQIALVLLLAPGKSGQVPPPLKDFPESSLQARYLQLNNWDSQHYRDIANRGYQLPTSDLSAITSDDVHSDRANVGFFPAYPTLGRALSQLTGLNPEVSLLIVSQIACFGFWLYFFLFLARRSPSRETMFSAGLAAAAYPTAFFLVLGYSESLFMAALLGMIYWTEVGVQDRTVRPNGGVAWLFATVHGALLTSTRLVGIPLVIYPVARVLFLRKRNGRVETSSPVAAWVGAISASALSLGGVAAFFAYCHLRFGVWNLYILLQQKGWQNLPDYLALLKPGSYVPRFFFEDTMDSISRASVPFALGFLGYSVAKDRESQDSYDRAPLYGVAFLAFYIAVSGKANANMDSMSRYTLPVYLLIVLSWAWRRRIGISTWSRAARLGVMFAIVLQIYLAYMFLRGHWVA